MAGDDEPVEAYTVPEIFVDGFTSHALRDGVMTCVGYRKLIEGKIVVVKLVWPAVNTNAAIDDANAAMDAANRPIPTGKRNGPKKGIH